MSGESGMSEPLAAISQRLYQEFGSDIALSEILAVLRHCREELLPTPTGVTPELLEQLGRECLEVIAADSSPAHGSATPGSNS
jgi:hypothetical protein